MFSVENSTLISFKFNFKIIMSLLSPQELQMADQKCRSMGSKLNLNILYQILLISIGISTFIRPDILKDNSIFGIKFSESLAHIIVPLILLYLFVRMGYMFWTYYNTRLVIDREINKISSDADSIQKRYTIYSHNDVAELVYLFFKSNEQKSLGIQEDKANPKPTGRFKFSITFWFAYILMIIFSFNHSIMFIFIFDFFYPPFIQWLAFITSGIILLGCYYEFYRMTKLKDIINNKNNHNIKGGISKYFLRLLIWEPILIIFWTVLYYMDIWKYFF